MDLELRGKTALVTGGSKGIGKAIALGLGREGARVAICARDKAALEQVEAEVRIPADLSHLGEVERVAATARERLGRIDILVNNAGAIRGGAFLDIPDQQWSDDWSLKLLGYIRMCRAVFPLMKAQGGGRIVNVVGAANAALVNFTKGLADLGAESKILVTAVSPAATATERWESLIAQQARAQGRPIEDLRREASAAYKLGRIATSEDIADIVCFLVSARASFITGICVTVDGGATRGVYA